MTQKPPKKKLPVLRAWGDENQDWIKVANPKAHEEELQIHAELAEKYKQEKPRSESSGDTIIKDNNNP